MNGLFSLDSADCASEDLETSFSTQATQATLASRSSLQSLANFKSPGHAKTSSPITSSSVRTNSRIKNHTRRSSILHKSFRINPENKRPSSLEGFPNKEYVYSEWVSSVKQDTGGYHLGSVLQQLAEVTSNQDRLLTLLEKTNNNVNLDFLFPYVNLDPSRPNPIKFNPSFLQKYIQNTLHPDSVRLYDMFLARYSLPHVLSGPDDPIELIHAHG
ncbi:hypothetical protein F5Y11DRAFT_110719 [Daldinia sp. FL1419]|nr:hypothetical protein F5Y11DRAFT_110719 [Daldinia sp. FL1419]